MPAQTPADPEVHARPVDPNAAGATTPPTTTTPGDQSPDIYAPVVSNPDPETPAEPVAQTVKEELGGESGFGAVDTVEEGVLTAPTQGGEETLAAPGTLPTGGDNIATSYDGHDHGGGRSLPVSNTQDPETPVVSSGAINSAPYLGVPSVGQEPAGV